MVTKLSRQQRLNTVQNQMGLPQLKLKQDVLTRWNKTFDMFTRIHKIKGALVAFTLLSQDHTITPRLADNKKSSSSFVKF